MTKSFTSKIRTNRKANTLLGVLALYALLAAGYIGLRVAWQFRDADTIRLTMTSRNTFREGVLIPSTGAYPFGYAYPALNTFLAHLTGIPIAALQTFVQPFLIVLLVPVSYVAFHNLTGRPTVAMLASLLLFLQPEFLFEATRSSHAKVTWLTALMMLFVLARSFRPGQTGRRFAIWVILFYLFTFALITSSIFFASNYIFGLAFALFGTYAFALLRREREFVTPQMRRLSYVTLASLLLAFVFIFYLYPPAQNPLSELQRIIDKVAIFFFSTEIVSSDPYRYVQSTWISTPLYVALTGLNWLVLAVSFTVWLFKGWQLLVRRQVLPAQALLLWLLYAAFAILLAISVTLDLAGVLSANLQVRVFPHLMIVAIPLASEGIVLLVSRARSKRQVKHKVLAAVVVSALLLFSAASLLKATNEPLFSNNWAFLSPGEQRSLHWIGDYLHSTGVWLGPDNRLTQQVEELVNWRERGINPLWGTDTTSRYCLFSTLMVANAQRRSYLLPDTRMYMRVYDDGAAALYFRRPQTPYQR